MVWKGKVCTDDRTSKTNKMQEINYYDNNEDNWMLNNHSNLFCIVCCYFIEILVATI